jgi:hypothetical protein
MFLATVLRSLKANFAKRLLDESSREFLNDYIKNVRAVSGAPPWEEGHWG